MKSDAPLVPPAYNVPQDTERSTVSPDGRPLAEQPRWRQDFPVDWPQDEYVSRRDLVKFVALTSLAFTAGQFWLVAESLLRGPSGATLPAVAVARVDELPVGGAKVFEYPAGSTPRLLVRTGEQSFVAYDQQCTHLLCPIVPAQRTGASLASTERGLQLHCPCHNGWFDLSTGHPIAGPPRRPLPRVTVEVRGGVVYATGVEGAAA